jgi:hypothetical protein
MGGRGFALAGALAVMAAAAPAEAQQAAFATTLPSTADGAVELRERESGVTVRFRLEGATPARATSAGDDVVYPAALGGADLVRRPIEGGLEELVRFPVRPEREEVRYVLDLVHVARVRARDDVIEFCDDEGTPQLRVTAPFVTDANGVAHTPRLELERCTPALGPPAPHSSESSVLEETKCSLRVAWSIDAYPAELDPAWTSAGSMVTPRFNFATVMMNNGDVMVFGGAQGPVQHEPGPPTNATEIYLADKRRWQARTAIGNADPDAKGRQHLAAVALNADLVFVVGGMHCAPDGPQCNDNPTEAWLYSGDNDTWTQALAMSGQKPRPHSWATATLIDDNGKKRILVTGDSTVDTYEFDDTSATLIRTKTMTADRRGHTATAFGGSDDQHRVGVLVCGGQDQGARKTCERYADGKWDSTKITMNSAHSAHTATLVNDQILIAGGGDHLQQLQQVEIIAKPAVDTGFVTVASMGNSPTIPRCNAHGRRQCHGVRGL